MTTSTDLIERLATHKTLSAAPREELEWLAAHGTVRRFAEGDAMISKGEPVDNLFVLLSGHVALYQDRGTGRNKIVEWYAGDVTGVLPYSRVANSPGDAIAQEPMEILAVPRDDLPGMIRECPQITGILVHKMLDRARLFTSSSLHDEKMVSLGKLAAGLAHELNNPAAAIERSAAMLEERLDDSDEATRALAAAKLTDAQLGAVDIVRKTCLAKAVAGVLSPIQQAEREDAIAEWLARHGVSAATAEPLAETSVTIDALDRIAEVVSGPALDVVLRWTAAGCSVRGIASEIQEASMRISGLVVAIKGFTHMDQALAAEPVDLSRSLGNTVTVLKSKARSKSIAVAVNVDPKLPQVQGFAGELNQIWANLIDNALDAAPDAGHVEVNAVCERDRVVVRVIDNGAGIPEEVRGRLFEPFVTTKPVGKGTGLGLDIVRRLVNHNEADIEFHSVPGRTEFRVSLPRADAQPVKADAQPVKASS